jgi:hypothetical protein
MKFVRLGAPLLTAVLALSLQGACSTAAPSATDAGLEDGGDFGCCPDIKTGCTLRRYGKRASANDSCVVGNDGLVPDPAAPGWTLVVGADGCPVWAAPKGVGLFLCGARPPVEPPPQEDADVPDADVPDASSDASTDAPNDAPNDAARD